MPRRVVFAGDVFKLAPADIERLVKRVLVQSYRPRVIVIYPEFIEPEAEHGIGHRKRSSHQYGREIPETGVTADNGPREYKKKRKMDHVASESAYNPFFRVDGNPVL